MLHHSEKVVGITHASAPVQDPLVLYGITETIGTDHIFASNRTALLAAYLDHRRVGEG